METAERGTEHADAGHVQRADPCGEKQDRQQEHQRGAVDTTQPTARMIRKSMSQSPPEADITNARQ